MASAGVVRSTPASRMKKAARQVPVIITRQRLKA